MRGDGRDPEFMQKEGEKPAEQASSSICAILSPIRRSSQDRFPRSGCVRVCDRCCAGRVLPAVHYCWRRCGREHKQAGPLTQCTPAAAG
ncbi:hypothetical protein EYF80_018035 [Liparis tanakae]|uniref:Uncharacterized protein n=1 Tax=Liparis tanakae TaxID=230148 RepID=A0A4Z2I2Z0_9TELE|nr:hypothetical protein EYF80_018035 [Liparis tanakae]